MSTAWAAFAANAPCPSPQAVPTRSMLSSLAYRSRALTSQTPAEIRRLLLEAQARNRAEAITGLLVHYEGQYFQWLEGPSAALARLWESISRDPRHTDIEIVGSSPTPVRFFADWSLKLVSLHPGTDRFLDGLGSWPVQTFFGVREASLLAMAQLATPQARPVVVSAPPLERLTRLLLSDDPSAAFDMVRGLHSATRSMRSLVTDVLEPSARRLGDLWCSDDCTEADLSIGLARLQTFLRRLDHSSTPPLRSPHGIVLVAPLPGECHFLGAILDAEMLWQSGWQPHCEFPDSDESLHDLLRAHWFDALDLSLSVAFRREHRLESMATMIERARAVSLNPRLRVIVGGRVFFEEPRAVHRIGADAGGGSAADIGERLGAGTIGARA